MVAGAQPELGFGAPPEGEVTESVALCEAATLKGARCSRPAREGSAFCGHHKGHEDEGEPGVEIQLADSAGAVREPRRESGEYSELMTLVAGREGVEAVDMLERLVQLKERAEDRDAERALNYAVAAFKDECPQIPKDGVVDYVGKNNRRVKFRHSKLSTICRIVDPVLVKHGLSYTWDSEAPDKGLGRRTICTLAHIDGATRTATFDAPPSGASTSADVQKVGAALTYGQRYSLIMVLGLTATLDDVDGMGPNQPEDHGEPITEEHLVILTDHVESTGANLKKLLAVLQVESLADLPDARFEDVLADVKMVGEQRASRG